MIRKFFIFLTLVLGIISTGAEAADPSLHQVYQAAEAGDLALAQRMMKQVLQDHPKSAKAHFVEAELLVRQGDLRNAKDELELAERLDPGLPFAKPGAVTDLRHRLNDALPAPVSRDAGALAFSQATGHPQVFPWGLILVGIGVLAAFAFFLFRLRRLPVAVPGGGYGPVPAASGWGTSPSSPYGSGGFAGPVPATGGGLGSGILGGLATGAAVGAGMVAGEALMHRVLDGGHPDMASAAPSAAVGTWDNPDVQGVLNDMEGEDFGVTDGGSWDDGAASGGDDWS